MEIPRLGITRLLGIDLGPPSWKQFQSQGRSQSRPWCFNGLDSPHMRHLVTGSCWMETKWFFWMFLVHDSTKNKMNFRHRAGQFPVEFTAKKQITKQPWKSTLQGQCALLDAVAECGQALLYGLYTKHAWCNGCLCSVCTYSLHGPKLCEFAFPCCWVQT